MRSNKKLFASGELTISGLAVIRLRNLSNSRCLKAVSSWDDLPAAVKVISASGNPGITNAGNTFFKSLRKSANSLNLLSTFSVCPPMVCGEVVPGYKQKEGEEERKESEKNSNRLNRVNHVRLLQETPGIDEPRTSDGNVTPFRVVWT